jgi:hypothetical protein
MLDGLKRLVASGGLLWVSGGKGREEAMHRSFVTARRSMLTDAAIGPVVKWGRNRRPRRPIRKLVVDRHCLRGKIVRGFEVEDATRGGAADPLRRPALG